MSNSVVSKLYCTYLQFAKGMQMFLRRSGELIAADSILFAIGLLICLKANVPSFTKGKAPRTIVKPCLFAKFELKMMKFSDPLQTARNQYLLHS